MRLGVLLLMVTVAAVWSGGWVVGKVAVTTVPPLAFSLVRFVIAAGLLLALVAARGDRLPRAGWPALLALGATGVLGYNAFVFVGLVHAPATDGGLIVPTLAPVLAAVLAAVLAGEPLTRAKVMGLFTSSAGVVLIVAGAGDLGALSTERVLGDLLLVGGALSWAAYTVIAKGVMRGSSPLAVTAVSAAVGAPMLLPAAYAEGGLADIAAWPLEAWLATLYMVVFATIVGFIAFHTIVTRVGAAQASTTTYLIPVGAVALAALFLGETVTPTQLLGGALALAGMRIAAVPAGEASWLRRFVGV